VEISTRNEEKPTRVSRKARYQPTASEQSTLDKHFNRLEAAALGPRLKVVKDGKSAAISLDHQDEDVALKLLMEALGTADADFAEGLLMQMLYSNSGERASRNSQAAQDRPCVDLSRVGFLRRSTAAADWRIFE
jgi:hypothetical protein